MKSRMIAGMLCFLCLIALTALYPTRCTAAPVTVKATGVVDFVSPELSTSASVDDPIVSYYTYDTTWPDMDPDPEEGYYHGSCAYDYAVGGAIGSPADVGIAIFNDSFGKDEYQARTFLTAQPDPGPMVGTLAPWCFQIVLRDVTQTALSGDGLSTSPPDLADFGTEASAKLIYRDAINPPPAGVPLPYVNGDLTSLTAVPIPATVWLLGCGLIGLVGIRRRLHK